MAVATEMERVRQSAHQLASQVAHTLGGSVTQADRDLVAALNDVANRMRDGAQALMHAHRLG